MACVWPCFLLALITSRTGLGREIVSSHNSRNVAAHPVYVRRGNLATQAAASYYDRSPSLRRLESTYQDSTNFGEHPALNTDKVVAASYYDRSPSLRRLESSYQDTTNFGEHSAVNSEKVVADDYEHANARPAMDTSFHLLKTMHPSQQSKFQKMQQQFEKPKKTILTTFSDERETEVPTFGPLTNSRETQESIQIISNREENQANPISFGKESLNYHSLFRNIEIDTRDVKEDVQSEPLPQSVKQLLEQKSLYDYPTSSELSTPTKNANQPRSEPNLLSKLKGTLTDFVGNTFNFFHPTRTGKKDSGSFRQTLLEYLQNSMPEKFSAVDDFQLEKNYDVKNSRLEKLPIVEKSNQFEKHSIVSEPNTRIIYNSGEFFPTSWSETDDVQMKLDEEPVFPMSTGFNELNSNPEIQHENEMNSLNGFVNSTMTLEILKMIQPVLSDALGHSNFTEDELLNVLEDPDRLRQVLIEKTTDDHALGLLNVFQHYKGLSTSELLQNMTRLDPSKLALYVEGLASEVRDSLHKTRGLGTPFGSGVEDDTSPWVAHDSQYSESSMYPSYSDSIQRPPQEYISPRTGHPYDYSHLGQFEDAENRAGSINISNSLFNLTFVSPKLASVGTNVGSQFVEFPNLAFLTQNLNSTSSLLKLPLLAALVKSSVIGLGALLALLVGSHYLKSDKGHGYESSYILVAPKSGYNSRIYAQKKLIMELPTKKHLEDEHRRESSANTVPLLSIVSEKHVKTIPIPIPPLKHPGGSKKSPRPSYPSARPPYRSDKPDTFDHVYYDKFTNAQGEQIDHPRKGDPSIFEGHKDVGYDSNQRGRLNHRRSSESVHDSSVLFSSDEYYGSRNKPSTGRYYEKSSQRDRPRIKPDSLGRYERLRVTIRRKPKIPDRKRNFSTELKRDIYTSWEKGRASVSRPFLSREDERRSRHRSQSSIRRRGHSHQSSKPKYRGNVPPANMAGAEDFRTQPISMKVELGVPYIEDNGKPSRRFKSSGSTQHAEYGNNMDQFGSHSSSSARSPGYNTFRGHSGSTQRPIYTAASPKIKWPLKSSHTSPRGSAAQPKDSVVRPAHPPFTSWPYRRDQILPSREPLGIHVSSPISADFDVFANLDGDATYP